MGRCPHNKAGGQKKKYSHKRARLSKFLKKGDDMVYEELKAPVNELKPTENDLKKSLDEDLPGMGQWYCLHCDRYFASTGVRDEHFKTKLHKKRVKLMQGAKPHCQLDADVAGGMGLPDNGSKLRCSDISVPMTEIA